MTRASRAMKQSCSPCHPRTDARTARRPRPSRSRPTTCQWSTTLTAVTPLTRVRQEGRGAIVKGKLWVFGGFSSNAVNATGQVDIDDIATNTWSKLPEYGPMPHTHSSVAVDGNAIYFVGGLFGDFPGVPTDRVFKFDTVTRTWSEPLPKLPVAFHSGGAAIVNGNLHYFEIGR